MSSPNPVLMLKIPPVLMFAPLIAFIQPQTQTSLKITTSSLLILPSALTAMYASQNVRSRRFS